MVDELSKKAEEILTKNTVKIRKKDRNQILDISYTAPSPGTYNQQWFWDSCLHSLVWFELGNLDRAYWELKSLFIGKRDRKLFPHMIFWKIRRDPYWWVFDHLYPTKKYSELIQPPIIGYPLQQIIISDNSEHREFVKETSQYYKHLFEVRDPEKLGLISIIHPWESGLDSSPKFDLDLSQANNFRLRQWKRMRSLLKEFANCNWDQLSMAKNSSFRIKCVLTNSLLAWGIDSFLNILDSLKFVDEKSILESKKCELIDSLIEHCWDEKEGLFYDIDMNQETKQVKVSTISSLMPLMLDIPKDIKDSLIGHLVDKEEYWSDYPIPTVSMKEKSFKPTDSALLWRGPTWVNTNYFIWLGLKKHNEVKLANELALKTTQLVEKSGFREFYNPLTGEGAGAENFGWSTLAILMKEKY